MAFRAIMRIDPYYSGEYGFSEMCKLVARQKGPDARNYLRGWKGLCREMGVVFKYREIIGPRWRKKFKEGIMAIDERVDRIPLFLDSLKLMDGLDEEFEKEMEQPEKVSASTWNECLRKVV